MDSIRIRRIKKILRNTKGELLIESLASFLILVIVLVSVTTVIMTSSNFNNRAEDNTAKIEKTIEDIEAGTAKPKGDVTGTININIDGAVYEQNIQIGNENGITYFILKK